MIRVEQKDVENWLERRLKGRGEVNVEDIRRDARATGIKRKQLREAKRALGVETINDWAANGETLNWFWLLPQQGVKTTCANET